MKLNYGFWELEFADDESPERLFYNETKNKSTCKFEDLPPGTLFSTRLYNFIKIEEVTDATGYHGNSVTAKGNVVWIDDDVEVIEH